MAPDPKYNQGFALKHKLRQLLLAIVDADDFTVRTADEAILTLSDLKNLKCDPSSFSPSRNVDPPTPVTPPPHFRCPISGQLMSDPVILASGQTYDRPFIQKWLNEVHRICPQTQEVLSHSILTPNCLVQGMISEWCKEQGIELSKPVGDIYCQGVTDEHRNRLSSLLYKLSLSVSDQKEAAKEIRLLTKQMPSIRTLFGNSEVIQKLLCPLSADRVHVEPELQEDIITTVLNLSILEDNKKVLAEDEKVISVLVESLKYGAIQTKSNAAAALFALSSLESNKHIIGKSEAIRYLINLVGEGNPQAMKDAASALFNLCYVHEIKETAVREGAVQVILRKMMDHIFVDELLALLTLLSSHSKAVEALANHGAVHFLLGLLRETTTERIKENCAVVLYSICFQDRSKRKEMREDETANGTMSKLAKSQTSTARAKRKAIGILDKLNATPSSSHGS